MASCIMRLVYLIILILLLPFNAKCQQFITKSLKEFGAKGNGRANDQEAFKKASAFFNKRKGNGKLVIPKGIYITGRQRFTGNEPGSDKAYAGEYALDLRGCDNMVIEGKPGAIIKNADSLRIGTFSPVTGKKFKHAMKDINIDPVYSSYATSAGIVIYLSECSNISIAGLILDGNMNGFIFGGNWGSGRNAYELIHYGIYIIDSHDITLNNCAIKNFACDGLYIANLGKEVKTFNININKVKVNYCGRNGLSWLGGENIRVTNSVFSNQGQGVVHESPAAGIDIEVENNSFCRKGYFYNCIMENNIGSAIASGSKELSSDILFEKCIAASPVYYSVFVDAASHTFADCSFYGSVLVWFKGTTGKDGTVFKRCIFEENYKGKIMYDGSYQLGAEATGVTVDSCTFKSNTISNYFLNAHTDNCSKNNQQKIQVNNSMFYNYGKSGFKLADKIAGIGRQTVFYNNTFYSQQSVQFLNESNTNCQADGGKNQYLPVSVN